MGVLTFPPSRNACRLSAAVRIGTVQKFVAMDDADVIGLNRLSASVRIWTELLACLDKFAVALVLIAFRLPSEFGRGSAII